MSTDPADHADFTAVNWPGDVASLTHDQLHFRMEALASFVCASLRPWSPAWSATSPTPGARDKQEAERVLDLWAACRDEMDKRLGLGGAGGVGRET